MIRNLHQPLLLVMFVLVVLLTQCQTEESSLPDYNLSIKQATVMLPYHSPSDTAGMAGEAETRFPLEYTAAKIKVIGPWIYVNFNLQWPCYARLRWKDFNQRIFIMPNDTLQLTERQEGIEYTGVTALMNTYLREKEKALQTTNFIGAKGSLSSTATNLDELRQTVNSISKKELDFLAAYQQSADLPQWFVDFERSDIQYFGGVVQLNSPGYRSSLMGLEETPPEDYYDFVEELAINNPAATLSVYYFEYLLKLGSHLAATDSVKALSIKDRVPLVFNESLKLYSQELSPQLRDYMYAYQLSRAIIAGYPLDHQHINDAIKAINDSTLVRLIKNIQHKKAQNSLLPGSPAPNFSISDGDSIFTLNQFKGKVVLLSFWATWCKACILEFPYENMLNDQLKGQDFALISICVGTSIETSQKILEKNPLNTINLYASNAERETLNAEYNIYGLPHYVLIDKDGNIIENKTRRPSEKQLRAKINEFLD